MLLRLFRKHKLKVAKTLLIFMASGLSFESVFALSGENGTKIVSKQVSKQPLIRQDRSIYSMVADMHLPSLNDLETEELAQLHEIEAKNEKALREKKGKELVIPDLGEVEKLRLVYQLFDNDSTQKNEIVPQDRSILDQSIYKDLEIYCGSVDNMEHNLFSQIDNTKTVFGKVYLQAMIGAKYDGADVLKSEIRRKVAIVKYLTTHEDVFNKIDEQLDLIKSGENKLMWFWKEMNEIISSHFDSICLKRFGLQENALAQGISAEWTRFGNPAMWITGTWFVLGYLLIKNCHTSLGLLFSEYKMDELKDMLEEDGNILKNVFYPYGCPTGTLIGLLAKFKKNDFENFVDEIRHKDKDDYPVYLAMFTLFVIATASLYFLFWRPVGRNFANMNKISKQMQEKMISVANVSNSASELGRIIKSDSAIASLFFGVEDLQVGPDSECNDFFDVLAKDTFKGQASFWSNKGRVIASFKKMFRLKDKLVGKLKAIGEIDAFMSIAKLYKKHSENANAKYCFVDVVDADRPYIYLQNGWHPYLDADKAVTNDVELGSDSSGNNMILTGPNASGKSVYLRMLVISLLFATSFGIAPASVLKFTPFAKIATYLNIADVVGKDSLFQAELRRAGDLLELQRNLKPGEFMFADIDEPYTGTNPEEASKAAYNFAKSFNKQSICIFATHYKELTDLETETAGFFRNYKVCVELLADGGLNRTYKVTPGIGDQRVATIMTEQALGKYYSKTMTDVEVN